MEMCQAKGGEGVVCVSWAQADAGPAEAGGQEFPAGAVEVEAS